MATAQTPVSFMISIAFCGNKSKTLTISQCFFVLGGGPELSVVCFLFRVDLGFGESSLWGLMIDSGVKRKVLLGSSFRSSGSSEGSGVHCRSSPLRAGKRRSRR